jgi:hypothetical protein
MLVYAQSQDHQPLMPTHPAKARYLLKADKARVVRRTPFTIRLLYDAGNRVQPLTHAVDTGSGTLGSAVAGDTGRLYYISQVEVRNDIRRALEQRSEKRGFRRNRKTRYRPCRNLNRTNSTKKGRFSPTMVSKFHAHHKEIRFAASLLPISKLVLETGTFDPHALKNPDVHIDKALYQKGTNFGFENTKAYVLHRDEYTCRHCHGKSGDRRLHVHHIVYREHHGSDDESNLATLCKTCHDGVHSGAVTLKLRGKRRGFIFHATQMNSIRVQLLKAYPGAAETFGYITKAYRQKYTDQKTHALDAVFAATCGVNPTFGATTILYKTCQADGDYQQTKGIRSERRIPRTKIGGFRKFDKVRFRGKDYFIKGRMSTGYAVLMDRQGNKTKLSPMPKLNLLRRIAARTSWRITEETMPSF